MRGGTWEFPIVESIHIFALAILVGSIVVIDLRLMGVLMHGWKVAGLARELRPYFNWSLVIILITGVLLFLSEALKAYTNGAFWVKVYLLAAALTFHFTAVRKAAKAEEVSLGTGRVVGLISLVLWVGVGWAGRAIGFV
jgi:hypothetical protein